MKFISTFLTPWCVYYPFTPPPAPRPLYATGNLTPELVPYYFRLNVVVKFNWTFGRQKNEPGPEQRSKGLNYNITETLLHMKMGHTP